MGLDWLGRSEDGEVGLVDLFLFGWLWMGWLVLDWRGWGWRGRSDDMDWDWEVREERRLLSSSLSLVSWAIWSRRVWMMESR